MILDEVNESVSKAGKDVANVDKMINLDTKFSEYKKLVTDCATLVDRFWS